MVDEAQQLPTTVTLQERRINSPSLEVPPQQEKGNKLSGLYSATTNKFRRGSDVIRSLDYKTAAEHPDQQTQLQIAYKKAELRLAKVRERVFTLRKKAESTLSSENIEDNITLLEAELGIRTEADRLMEASLFIDRKFMEIAAITGNTEHVERTFGDEAWADYLDARLAAKEYGDQDVTTDFIRELHTKIARRSHPEGAGNLRTCEAFGAHYNGKDAEHFTSAQKAVLKDNPYLKFYQIGSDPNVGMIVYPKSQQLYVEKYPLSEKAKQLFIEKGKTQEVLIEVMLTDLCDWYNGARRDGRDPYVLAAELQQRFISIHPFTDNNGRLSRLVMQWSLENNGQAPAVLEEPGEDLFTSRNEWMQRVKQGSERYQQMQNRKTLLEQAGIHDNVELLGLDEERTFYECIYKHIQKPPNQTKENTLDHKVFEAFIGNLRKELQLFNEEFTARAVYKHYDWKKRENVYPVQEGGLLSQHYVNCYREANTKLDQYILHRFFTDEKMYRGAVVFSDIQDEDICNIFTEPTPLNASYRILAESKNRGSEFTSLQDETVLRSYEDYNLLMSSAYLARHYPSANVTKAFGMVRNEMRLGKSPLDVFRRVIMGKYLGGLVQTHAKGVPTFLDDTTEKFDDEFETSPFVSTSTSRKTGKSYARGGFLEQANPNIRHGILVTSRAPKIASISTYNKEPIQFDEKGREITHPHIPALSDVRTNHPEEYEMLLPGIIDPRSVDKIEIYDGLFPIKDTSVEPQVIVHRSFIDSSEVITIVNYRGSSEGEKKQYVMNDTTGKFELVTKQHDTHLALAA